MCASSESIKKPISPAVAGAGAHPSLENPTSNGQPRQGISSPQQCLHPLTSPGCLVPSSALTLVHLYLLAEQFQLCQPSAGQIREGSLSWGSCCLWVSLGSEVSGGYGIPPKWGEALRSLIWWCHPCPWQGAGTGCALRCLPVQTIL